MAGPEIVHLEDKAKKNNTFIPLSDAEFQVLPDNFKAAYLQEMAVHVRDTIGTPEELLRAIEATQAALNALPDGSDKDSRMWNFNREFRDMATSLRERITNAVKPYDKKDYAPHESIPLETCLQKVSELEDISDHHEIIDRVRNLTEDQLAEVRKGYANQDPQYVSYPYVRAIRNYVAQKGDSEINKSDLLDVSGAIKTKTVDTNDRGSTTELKNRLSRAEEEIETLRAALAERNTEIKRLGSRFNLTSIPRVIDAKARTFAWAALDTFVNRTSNTLNKTALGLCTLGLLFCTNEAIRDFVSSLLSTPPASFKPPHALNLVGPELVPSVIDHGLDHSVLTPLSGTIEITKAGVGKGGFHSLVSMPQLQAAGIDSLPRAAQQQLATVFKKVFTHREYWEKLMTDTVSVGTFLDGKSINLSALTDPDVVSAVNEEIKKGAGGATRLLASRLPEGGYSELLNRKMR